MQRAIVIEAQHGKQQNAARVRRTEGYSVETITPKPSACSRCQAQATWQAGYVRTSSHNLVVKDMYRVTQVTPNVLADLAA